MTVGEVDSGISIVEIRKLLLGDFDAIDVLFPNPKVRHEMFERLSAHPGLVKGDVKFSEHENNKLRFELKD